MFVGWVVMVVTGVEEDITAMGGQSLFAEAVEEPSRQLYHLLKLMGRRRRYRGEPVEAVVLPIYRMVEVVVGVAWS